MSLADYVARMKERQAQAKAIYYVTADTPAAALAARTSRCSARRTSRCCCCTERVDEWLVSYLHEFEEVPLASVAKGDLDLGELADAEEKEAQREDRDRVPAAARRRSRARSASA